MRRPLLIALAAAGPLFVAALRLVLPYYSAPDGVGSATDVAAELGTQSLVLWLGLGALLTLVPGLYAVWPLMPQGRLRDVGFTLAVIGYLCMSGLFVTDHLLWVGVDQGLSAETTGRLVEGLHTSALVQLVLFVPTHIIGIVLIGTLALRARVIPAAAAWGLIVSQPLHLASVIAGLPPLDFTSWTLTGVGMAWLSAVLTSSSKLSSSRSPSTPVTH
jgi:hypothetical protein